MKTMQLPPVRVAPAVREEIESALHEGESLSAFVEAAVLRAARARKAQQQFIARGQASLARAQQTGTRHAVDEALDAMQSRLAKRVAEQRAPAPVTMTMATRSKPTKP